MQRQQQQDEDESSSLLFLNRKLTIDEVSALRSLLQTELPSLVEDAEDITDLLDYTFAMISNSKSVPYMEGELKELCSEDAAKRIGEILLSYFRTIESVASTTGTSDTTNDTATAATTTTSSSTTSTKLPLKKTIKASGEALGNALTTSGALGSSRIGKSNKLNNNNTKPEVNKVNSNTLTSTTTANTTSSSSNNSSKQKRKEPLSLDKEHTNTVTSTSTTFTAQKSMTGRGGERKRDNNNLRGGKGGNERGTSNRGGRADFDKRAGRSITTTSTTTTPGRTGLAMERLTDPETRQRREGNRGGDGRGRGTGRGHDDDRRARGINQRGGGRDDAMGRGRISGHRRARNDMDEEDFIQAPRPPAARGGGREGRSFHDGRGRMLGDARGGRGANRDAGGRFGRGDRPPVPPENKRQRIEGEREWNEGHGGWQDGGGYEESYMTHGGYGGGYDEGYGVYDDGYGGYGGYHDGYGYGGYNDGWYGGQGRGRGRAGRFGRGRTDGRMGRGGGRFGRGGNADDAAPVDAGATSEQLHATIEGVPGSGADGHEGNHGAAFENGTLAGAAAGHPSPMVAAAFGGRGRGGRFSGRGGRGGYRAQVHTMIASKSWVRPKPDKDGAGGEGSGAGGLPAAEG